MAIIVPNTACILTADACVANSEDRFAWVGLLTPLTASGCVVWFRDNTNTTGCQLVTIIASPGQQVLLGPYNSPNGLYAASISGGSALAWLKKAA